MNLFRIPLLAVLLAGVTCSLLRADEPTPQWIWPEARAAGPEKAYFRKDFNIKRADVARLYATGDSEIEVFLNGKKVLDNKSWTKPKFADVTSFMVPGHNFLAVRGGKTKAGSAGVLVKLVMVTQTTGTDTLVTDASWKATLNPAEGWNLEPKFALSSWKPVTVIAPIGAGAWGNRLTEKMLADAAQLRKPEATPASAIKIKEGFGVDLLYSVPMETQGSWVASCFDDKGRLIVSDQYGKLFRVTLPALDAPNASVKVEEIPAPIGEAQGLVFANHALYVVTNSDKYPRGLWRVTSSKNDDTLDKAEQLRAFSNQGGEHGPHAVLLAPDGKSLYVIVGDQTPVTELDSSRVPQHWDEDILLPRIYGRGFMRTVMAPGGWVAKTDFDGKKWELMCTGFRNEYDASFNRHGDLFTYDADMEWDMSLPWYRPTRVCHIVSGGEFGWRNGSAKWPPRWEDNLPPIVDIGPGSPTGLCFGYGANFPAKYQDAFFMCDWSYGKLYAAHLKPSGATYSAEFEEFLSAQPLPLTDVLISPVDHAMYLLIGGRRVQSGLYRVTYRGTDSTAAHAEPMDATSQKLHDLRKQLETFHTGPNPMAVDFAWPYLGHEDRFIRFAARIAVEHNPVETWKERALNETHPRTALTALMALSRSAKGDKTLLPAIVDALNRLNLSTLKDLDRETLVRDYALALARLGPPDDATRAKLIARLSPSFPTKDTWLDVDLAEVLTYLGDPAFLPKAVDILDNAPTQEEQIAYGKTLRLATKGWTPELRQRYFKWVCLRAPTYKGGANMELFMQDIRRDAEAGLTEQEKAALKPILDAKPDIKAPQFTFTPRQFVKDWKIADLEGLLGVGLEGNRNYENGRNLFGAATCFVCHRFNNEGGAVGPDLTSVSGKYSPRDLLLNILEPSLEISDQYAQMEITLNDGNKVFGRINNLHGDAVVVNTNMMDPNALQSIDRRTIKSMEKSKVSMMPPGLLNTFTSSDILDLLAYLLSKGNKEDPMFK